MAQQDTAAGGMRDFTRVWAGQTVSLVGSGLTRFALGVWIYQRTGSITDFALILLFATLPAVLVSPVAGVFIDRWDRRRTLIGSDLAAALTTLAMAALLWADGLALWHAYLAVALSATADAFQKPAFTAASTLIVPREQFARAAGMVQTAQATAQILAPAAAGVLIATVGLAGVLVVDAATFLFSIATLLSVRIPSPPRAAGAPARPSFWTELAYGFRYIADRRGLLGLLFFFAAVNLALALAQAMTTPMVLALAPATVLGAVLGFAGVGMFVGGAAMSVWGGPRPRIRGVYRYGALMGAGLLLAGVYPAVPVVAAGLALVFFAVPGVIASSQAIWQTKTEPAVQGRVFSTRVMVAGASAPVAYLAAGPLADRVFEPLMAPGGPLAGTLGTVLGTGDGRGAALLVMLTGVLMLAATAACALSPRVRNVESELPDVVPPAPPAPRPQPVAEPAGAPAGTAAAGA